MITRPSTKKRKGGSEQGTPRGRAEEETTKTFTEGQIKLSVRGRTHRIDEMGTRSAKKEEPTIGNYEMGKQGRKALTAVISSSNIKRS